MKTMVITGTSSGIGKCLCEHFRCQGYEVTGIARNGQINTMLTDLSDPDQLDILCEELSLLPPPDVLINNAGIFDLEELSFLRTKIDSLISVNLTAVYFLCREVGKEMNSGSCIINIASISGVRCEEHSPMYSATKAGVIALTKSFAKLYAHKGVRVNSFSPGFINTNLVLGSLPKDLLDSIPLQREGEPEDLIPVVEFLIKSEYITGSNIVVDGGVLL